MLDGFLKGGAKPSRLLAPQPTAFELAIKLNTVRSFGPG